MARVVRPGGGEVVGDSADRRVEILSDGEALHVTWSRFGPGREGADLHMHRRHTDVFYVLAGELTLRLGVEGQEVVVPAGRLACIPPLVVHGFRNGPDAEVRYLNLHAPGRGFAEFLRSGVDYDQEPPPADGVRPPTDAIVGVRSAEAHGIAIGEQTLEPGASTAGAAFVLEGEIAGAPSGSWVEGAAQAGAQGARVLAVRV